MSSNSPSSRPWAILKPLGIIVAAIVLPLATLPPSIQALLPQNLWLKIILYGSYEIIIVLISLVTNVWEYLKPKWVQRIGDTFDQSVSFGLARYGQTYRRHFLSNHRYLDMKGMDTTGAFPLEIERVFVDLCVDPTPPHNASADILRLPTNVRVGKHSIWEYLHVSRKHMVHLILLGAPGSGKTTLLEYLGIELCQRRRSARYLSHMRGIPFLLFLREYSTLITKEPNYMLADAMYAQINTWNCDIPIGWIKQQLLRGRCLILLDGLDEVADTEQRTKIVEWVQAQMKGNARNQFIVTSRPYGYRENPLNGVTVLEVQPFSLVQIEHFVVNWYLENEIKRAIMQDSSTVRRIAQDASKDLLNRLHEKEALLVLAMNPLLLTMITTVHCYRGSLPGTRIELYAEICKVMLGKRQEEHGIKQDLSADQRQQILQSLAYQMMLQQTKELPYSDIVQIIQEPLQHMNSTVIPSAFLQSIENVSGLLLERELGSYSFVHLTFQEYLAATYIHNNGLEKWLAQHVSESWWHETIRLYCAQADATSLLQVCLLDAASSISLLTLALQCLSEARKVSPQIRQQFDILIEQGEENADPQRRRIIAEALLARRLH